MARQSPPQRNAGQAPRARQRKGRGGLWALLGFLLGGLVAAGGALLWLYLPQKTPAEEVMMEALEDIHVGFPLVLRPGEPSRVIYLNREGAVLTSGIDDARKNRSSIVSNTGKLELAFPPFRGSFSTWQRIVDCVRQKFAPFDVEVVSQRPMKGEYIMVLFGGKSTMLGRKGNKNKIHATGLAPFNSAPIRNAVAMVFADALHNRVRETCEIAGQEIAHAYGLDHAYNCRDLMTYLRRCSKTRSFVDKVVPCGEYEARQCADGKPTQNSFARIASVVGLRKQAAARSK